MSHEPPNSNPYAVLAALLDPLSAEPGALVVRGPNYWEAIPPGKIGQVLAMGEDGMPGWYWPDELPGGGSL